jgi:putative esterase
MAEIDVRLLVEDSHFAVGSPMRSRLLCVFVLALAAATTQAAARFDISFPASAEANPITGRLILILAKRGDPEPRMTLNSPIGPAIFGVDLDQTKPGQRVTLDARTLGSPVQLDKIPPGDYYAQAIIDRYTQVHRADGHTLWVPMNDGSIEWINTRTGNLYSDVKKIHLTPNASITLETNRVMTNTPPADTEWVKHVKIQSRKLTRFWGHPIFIHATVLLPKGYAEHPNVRYPSVYTLGHGTPFSFSTDPANGRNGETDAKTGLQSGYDFYQAWNSENFPRFIAITLEQRTPFFLDSYSVNSANNGPYGDAFVEEVVPDLEKQFRIISAPYARLIEGASTSGWQTLALQLRNPDFFGGAWVLQPDPIDFRHYQQTNIYEDDNAFTIDTGAFTTAERPMRRTLTGQTQWTQRQLSLFEAVLGSHGRSQFQLEAWEAVYGPVGSDGYPKPLWDKFTGKIDKEVANFMREHGYDLREYAQRNWATIGPKLIGKLHFFCGDMDDFYLNLAVYDFEAFLKSTANPHYEAEFTYGRPMKGHSWHAFPWQELVRRMAEHVRRNAPGGEGSTAWNY